MARTDSQSLLPSGTGAVGLGILINGVATYLFLMLPARSGSLTVAQYSLFSTLWLATYFVGPGLYVPLEQEMARLIAATRRSAATLTGASILALSAVGVLIVALALGRVVANRLFDGELAMVAVLAAAIVGTGVFGWAKGAFAGGLRFGEYAMVVGLEGVLRLAGVGLAVLLGVSSPIGFVVSIAVAPIAATVLVAMRARPPIAQGFDLDQDRVAAMGRSIGTLAIAQLGAQFLMNGTPLALAFITDASQQALVARIGAAVVLARVPIFAYQAVQASLLPDLARLVSADRMSAFRHRVGKVLGVAWISGLVGTAAGYVGGPFVLRLAFGESFVIRRVAFAALTASAFLIILALVAAQGLIALGRHGSVAAMWVLGVVVFIAMANVGTTPADRVLFAGLVGPAASATGLGAVLMLSSRVFTQSSPDLGSGR